MVPIYHFVCHVFEKVLQHLKKKKIKMNYSRGSLVFIRVGGHKTSKGFLVLDGYSLLFVLPFHLEKGFIRLKYKLKCSLYVFETNAIKIKEEVDLI